MQDAALRNQGAGTVRAVWAPKAAAARALLGGSWGAPTAAMALFSSVAGSVGSAGQANYGAANAALDGMASALQRQARQAPPGPAIDRRPSCRAVVHLSLADDGFVAGTTVASWRSPMHLAV